ncbi:MAG TPA: (d)CMP kinase, partial [Candidatus Pullichristensenella avicola]|nr:(d)CMP kinase [Candidatus Pullichristensenella avicola]
MQDVFSIAIDGPSGAGKSSVARAVAEKLGAMYLDTGAMYRAVGLYMLKAGVPLNDASAIAANCPGVDVRVG